MESSLIVSASADRTVRVWKAPKKLYTFRELGNLRPILEVLKFLSSKEVIGIARVNKQFYEASFHWEIQPGVSVFREVYLLEQSRRDGGTGQ